MGRDKLPLEIGGVPLLERVCRALRTPCAEVLVVGGSGVLPQAVRRVYDARPGGQGPLAGIEAGLCAARNRLVFVVAGDMPFVPEALVGFLTKRLAERGALAVVPSHGGRVHPLCAAYDREALSRVTEALDGGVRAVRGFLEGLDRVEYVEEDLRRFGDPDVFLMNVNSPQDLERARRLS